MSKALHPVGCPTCGEAISLLVDRAPSYLYLELGKKECECPTDGDYLERAYARLCDDGGEVSNV